MASIEDVKFIMERNLPRIFGMASLTDRLAICLTRVLKEGSTKTPNTDAAWKVLKEYELVVILEGR